MKHHIKTKFHFQVNQSLVKNQVRVEVFLFPSSTKLKETELDPELKEAAKRHGYRGKPKSCLSVDRGLKEKVIIASVARNRGSFHFLEVARIIAGHALGSKPDHIDVHLKSCWDPLLLECLVSGLLAASFEGPKYANGSVKKKDQREVTVNFLVPDGSGPVAKAGIEKGMAVTEGTNLVRWLTVMAGNDLTPTRFVEVATDLAEQVGATHEFYTVGKLKKMGAGAFLAVIQGAPSRGAGILKLHYNPPKAKKKIALVGKGITFDTGGSNLKPDPYMLGMHGDMGGAAVVLATLCYAAQRKWPIEVVAYLAIAENLLGPDSYRPNDVVTALNGKTIEVIHTDAEGRMVLADTLELASREKPEFILDFATLTGACIRAIGTRYSGAYSNRKNLHRRIVKAGRISGERVWPFPNDVDYGRCLKSEIADIKQCRPKGGVDHMEAGYFLRQFVNKSIPWVHVDLSAQECEGGLGHVSSDITGFGVRFAVELSSQVMMEAL